MPNIKCYLLVSLLAAVGLLSGCAHAGRGCVTSCGTSLPPVEELLPRADRGQLTPDTSALGAATAPAPAYRYYALTPRECQCLAVENSSLGNLLADERRAIRSGSGGRKMSASDCLRITILEAAEHEARNQNAAKALELYYHIAEGEALLDVADRSQQEIIDALAKVKQLRQRKLEIPFDATELERRWVKIESQRTAGERQLAEANHQLFSLLGLDTLNDNTRIWPETDLRVDPELLNDKSAEVDRGLSSRPEIAALYQLGGSLDAQTLEVARHALGRIDGLLGTNTFRVCAAVKQLPVPSHTNRREISIRSGQLASHAERLEQEITAQIRQQVDDVEIRLREVSLAQELVWRWDARLKDLAALQKIEKATFVEITQARLERLDAQADLIRAIVGWKIAVAKLRGEQGVLPLECSDCGPIEAPAPARRTVIDEPQLELRERPEPLVKPIIPSELLPDDPMGRPELELPRTPPRRMDDDETEEAAALMPAVPTAMPAERPAFFQPAVTGPIEMSAATPMPALAPKPIPTQASAAMPVQQTALFQPPPLPDVQDVASVRRLVHYEAATP